MILIVTYDLRGPAGTYEEFFDTLKSEDSWAHYLRSTWLVSTKKSPSEMYTELRPFLKSGDHLMISRLSKDRQGWLPKKAWAWVRRNED